MEYCRSSLGSLRAPPVHLEVSREPDILKSLVDTAGVLKYNYSHFLKMGGVPQVLFRFMLSPQVFILRMFLEVSACTSGSL